MLTMWLSAIAGICNKQNMVLNTAILLPTVQIGPVNWFPPSMRANISWISADFCTKPTRLSLWNSLWLIRSLQQTSYVVFIWLKFLLYTDLLLSLSLLIPPTVIKMHQISKNIFEEIARFIVQIIALNKYLTNFSRSRSDFYLFDEKLTENDDRTQFWLTLRMSNHSNFVISSNRWRITVPSSWRQGKSFDMNQREIVNMVRFFVFFSCLSWL